MSDPGMEADQPQGDDVEAESPNLRKIARWVAEIELYDRETSKWRNQAKRIIRRYKDDRGAHDDIKYGARFNAFWANVQTMRPSLYAKNPKPDIQRRFKDADPVGRVASDILERCSTYFTETDEFYAAVYQAVTDYLLPGRGTTWERYVPHMRPMQVEVTDDAEDDAEVPEEVAFEESITDYVHMLDFGHNICRTYDELWCGWRIVYMERDELVRRFGEDGKTVPLDYVQKDLSGEKLSDGISKAAIYELWDKNRKCAVWFHKTIPDALDLRADPLKLDGFFPFPKPLLTNLANDSLIPTPDYIESQDQYIELDDLTRRINSITAAVKVAGVYDASAEGINRLLNEGVENKLIPIENFAILAEKGGLANAFMLLPMQDIMKTLLGLYEARDKVKEDLHEISGMPDIARGSSDANETLGAQEIKTSFAINRISDKQREVQRFVREIIRLKVDVICGHFSLDTIKKISGVRLFTTQEKAEVKQFQQASQQPPQMGHNGGPPMGSPPQPGMPPAQPMPPPQPPQVLTGLSQDQIENMMNDPTWEEVEALFRNDAMRGFRIDIETDSTIKADEEQDKQSRIEFVTAIGKYLESALEAAQQSPELVPFLVEGLKFLARGFPVGKNMESALDVACQKLEKQAANPQPKPNPEVMKIQADQQMNQQKLQGDMQLAREKAQLDAQVAQSEQQAQAAQSQQENSMEAEREKNKLEAESQLQREKMSGDMDTELTKAYIAQKTAIVVARIGAGSTDGAIEEQEVDMKLGLKRDDELHGKLDALIGHLSNQASQAQQPPPPHPDMIHALNNLADAHRQSTQTHAAVANHQAQAMNEHSRQIGELHKAVSSEKEIVRDPKTGKPTGVRIKQADQTAH